MCYFRTCPRCNERSYEVLRTHAYCVSCNYSPDLTDQRLSSDDLPIPAWADKVATAKAKTKTTQPGEGAESSAGGAA